MREIKFRLWDTDNNRYLYWEPFKYYDNLVVEPDFWKEEILEQFTGLLDKHGKGIYEGDLVIEGHYPPKVVEYNEGGFDPFIYNGGGEYEYHCCEVVGNIHSNPELLEQ